MPLEFLLSIMRDVTKDEKIRMAAAGMALPFTSPRLSAVLSVNGSSGPGEKSRRLVDDWMAQIDHVTLKAAAPRPFPTDGEVIDLVPIDAESGE